MDPSGVGKTYALRQVFDVGKGFGCVSALRNPKIINGYQFLPEVSNKFAKKYEKEMWEFINNGNITVSDVNMDFKFNLMNKLDGAKVIALQANDAEIKWRLSNRNTRNERQYIKSAKKMTTLLKEGYDVMTQPQLIKYLTNLIYGDIPSNVPNL